MRASVPGPRVGPLSRRGWLLGVAVLVLAVLVGAGTALRGVVAPEPVAAAAGDVADWRGVKYRGTYVDASGVTTAVALTVAADGRAYGTFERPSGARAQLAVGSAGSMVKGNREWWLSVPAGEPDTRTDLWVAPPPGDAAGLAPVERLTPAGLGHDLTSPVAGTWHRTGDRVVDGRSGETWSDGSSEVVLSGDDGRPVLALAFPITEWWSVLGPGAGEPEEAPSVEKGGVPHEPKVQLSLEKPDDGEMKALEELAGKLQELAEKAQEVVEKSQDEDEKARHDRQSGNC